MVISVHSTCCDTVTDCKLLSTEQGLCDWNRELITYIDHPILFLRFFMKALTWQYPQVTLSVTSIWLADATPSFWINTWHLLFMFGCIASWADQSDANRHETFNIQEILIAKNSTANPLCSPDNSDPTNNFFHFCINTYHENQGLGIPSKCTGLYWGDCIMFCNTISLLEVLLLSHCRNLYGKWKDCKTHRIQNFPALVWNCELSQEHKLSQISLLLAERTRQNSSTMSFSS